MLLCKYFNPKLGYETEERIQDNGYYSFTQRKPDETPAMYCTKVVASGAWLDRIRKHFSHLPLMETGAYASTIAWYGDHAKFIAGNIADVCSAYFMFWKSDLPTDAQTFQETSLTALEVIQSLVKNHSINELERLVKIQEVLDGSK